MTTVRGSIAVMLSDQVSLLICKTCPDLPSDPTADLSVTWIPMSHFKHRAAPIIALQSVDSGPLSFARKTGSFLPAIQGYCQKVTQTGQVV